MSDFIIPARERRGQRRAVSLACDVVRERDYLPVGKKIVDLSPEGMQLLADGAGAEVGDPLQVLFKIPFTPEYVFVDAVVTRLVRGFRTGDSGPSYGVKFLPLRRDAQALLKKSLSRFPPPIRWRPRRIDYAATVRLIGCT